MKPPGSGAPNYQENQMAKAPRGRLASIMTRQKLCTGLLAGGNSPTGR
jgi:hypothetical protein